MKPTVSIVIPVYDGGPYIKSTPADTGYHLDERTVHKGSDLFHMSSLSIMTTFICEYTSKYSVFVLSVYGYNHKNYGSNAVFMACYLNEANP